MEEEKFNIKDGLSINEAKVSALIILCVLTFLFAFVMYVLDKDITDNLTSIIQTLILVIGGVNLSNSIASVFTKRSNK
ncbi:MAG: hypothetical protein ACLRPD_11740 [Megamonas funiformis]|uniref:hypothetical protein n=1 Tax=Megamonas funiformis TaxID=437897 RepID=UPI000E49F05D|nr:hypothetical protein [Megamonas funiformis]RHG04576.1 hypothetical protein DW639_10790 [Megamonas funiformis]